MVSDSLVHNQGLLNISDPNFVNQEIWIAIKLMPGEKSKDIEFEEQIPELINDRIIWHSCGKTRESEDLRYQPLPVEVCAYWTSVPDHLVVPQHGSRVFTFAMTADKNQTVAREELVKGYLFLFTHLLK